MRRSAFSRTSLASFPDISLLVHGVVTEDKVEGDEDGTCTVHAVVLFLRIEFICLALNISKLGYERRVQITRVNKMLLNETKSNKDLKIIILMCLLTK